MNWAADASVIASCTAVLVAVATLGASLYRRGQAEGRQTEILARLTAIAADHEDRLRAIEQMPGPRPRGSRPQPNASWRA